MNDGTRLATLAAAASNGDESAREALVRAMWPNAYRIAWSILGDRGAAEDAAQTACAALCAKLRTLSDSRAFAGWAYRIIVSHARDLARVRARLKSRESVGYDDVRRAAPDDDAALRLDLEAAIDRLPESLRLVLELTYFVGLTSGEVARALGIPAPTVRFRLMTARHRLRHFLDDNAASRATLESSS